MEIKSNIGFGDIVRCSFDAKGYYIVIDLLDLTIEGDEQPNIDFELMKIYPVSHRDDRVIVHINNISLFAKNGTKDHEVILSFIGNELRRFGVFEEPEHNKLLKPDGNSKEKKKAIKKLSDKEIEKILKDTTTDKKIEQYVKRLDTHLRLLHKALSDGDQDEVSFQKEQLVKVRNTLMELEYFQLEERRDGTSIKIK